MADAFLDRLRLLDSCAVSDAMDSLGRPSVALGLSALTTTRRIAGRAITVQLGPADGRPAGRHLCSAAVEACGPDSIIVVAHNGRLDVAGWGGILSLAATVRGVAGIVIDGVCRDLDESRELELAIFGRGAVPTTARGRIIELAWNVPVDICGVAVEPDDLVIADGSGVVVLPSAVAGAALSVAEGVARKEHLMAEAVRRGDPITQVMGANYETMLNAKAAG